MFGRATIRLGIGPHSSNYCVFSIECMGIREGYWTTRGYANSRIANSRTGQLADWTSRGLVNSRTGQVADWTTRGWHRRLCVLSFPFWRHLWDRELSSPRVDQSARCPVRELSSYRGLWPA